MSISSERDGDRGGEGGGDMVGGSREVGYWGGGEEVSGRRPANNDLMLGFD